MKTEATVHINGEPWTWFVTRDEDLVIRNPQRFKTVIQAPLVRQFWKDFLRSGKHQGPGIYHGVTPGMVKAYVESFIIPTAQKA